MCNSVVSSQSEAFFRLKAKNRSDIIDPHKKGLQVLRLEIELKVYRSLSFLVDPID